MISKRYSILTSLLIFVGFWLVFFNSAFSQSSITWQNAVNVTVSGNTITKTTPDNWDAGASSVQSIPAGYNGYVEFYMTNNAGMAGLSFGDPNVNYDIDYAIQAGPNSGSSVVVYEKRIQKATSPIPYSSSDIYRVAIESGIVKYYQNGTLIYTSIQTPTLPLLFDAALYTNGGKIRDVVIASSPIAEPPPPPPGPQAASGMVVIERFDSPDSEIFSTGEDIEFRFRIRVPASNDLALYSYCGSIGANRYLTWSMHAFDETLSNQIVDTNFLVYSYNLKDGNPNRVPIPGTDKQDVVLETFASLPFKLKLTPPPNVNAVTFFLVAHCDRTVPGLPSIDPNNSKNLAVSAPICFTITGTDGKCSVGGVRPGGPGTDVPFKWGIFNPLIGMSPNQNVFDLVVIIADWILNIAGSLIIILIIYSGVRFLISRGNPGEIQAAKNILFWALVGFGIILIGKGFIYLIESVLQGKIPMF